MPPATETTARDRDLRQSARGGDENAFALLTEPHRGELQAHCYRMLGSVHDAEDALQDAMLRAWRGLQRLEEQTALRAWLYKIATNTCLDAIAKRPKRVLPVDYGPAADPHVPPGDPQIESVWVEPYPDEKLAVEDGYTAPEASYEQREAVELAFIVALQNLPANQRAVLILREVLGFSAAEVAESLDTTVASVNSALQRARKSVEERTPEQSQQETLRSLGDDELSEIVDRYVDAWERNDIEGVVGMLAEDAAFTMPPMSTWFSGHDEIRIWLTNSPMSGEWEWKAVKTRANGQPALAFYSRNPGEGEFTPFALNVLTFRGGKISEVDAFINRTIDDPSREAMARMPDQPADERAMKAAFENFGMPATLPAD